MHTTVRRLASVLAALAVASLLAVLLVPSTAAAAKPDKAKKPEKTSEPDWYVDEATLPFDDLSITDVEADQYWGIHNNAGYRIEVPENWNGDLIMFAHGYRGEGERLFLYPGEGYTGGSSDAEFPDGFRKWMLEEGYAWAMSTYSKNSYNVSQGVKDTHALARYFNGVVAKPDNVYITGYSMGGHITAVSAENYGNTYAGAMPMCGVVGDYELFDFFLDLTVTAQQLALGESQFPVSDDWFSEDVPAIKDALGMNADPDTWFFFEDLPLTEAGEQYKQLVELISGGDRPNFDEAFTYWNSFPTATGLGNFMWERSTGDGTITGRNGIILDNTDAVYQVDLDAAINDVEQALNDNVVRIQQDRSGRSLNGLSNPPSVNGTMRMPVLSLHNLGDLFVPFHNETVYAAETAAQGNSDLLVQRAIRGVSHCGFTPNEMIEGMSDLVNWAENGVRPAGDNVGDPAAVAAADFGCAFTRYDDFGHTLATPCDGEG